MVACRDDLDDELVRRYAWFREEAERALLYFPLRTADVTLSNAALWQAARAHFLIMDAYKADHFSGDRTEDAKIAAVTTMAILALKPFRTLDPNNVISPWAARANELFAVRLSGPILNSGLPELAESDRMAWLFNFLAEVRVLSIITFIEDIASGRLQPAYEIKLSEKSEDGRSDLGQLSALMLLYHLLWRPQQRSS